MTRPDLFTNVHKGIRRALFETCLALGRATEGDATDAAAREMLRDTLRFVAHHGDNEDVLLLPLLQARAPALHERLAGDHAGIEAACAALAAASGTAPLPRLHHGLCAFTARYLDHMSLEEVDLEPALRAVLTDEEIATFGRRSVERTAPADQRMMLGWMLPAMTRPDADALLARLPAQVAEELRALAG